MQDFYSILTSVQEYISKNYSSLLEQGASRELLESYIDYFLRQQSFHLDGYDTEQLRNRILEEMTSFSFLTSYLNNPNVEEINVNSWEDVKVTFTNGETVSTPERFQSPEHAVNVVRRMLSQNNIVWDASKPIQVGHLPGNIRITAIGYDVIDDDKALSVSIRKVNGRKLQKADFVRSGTITDEMMDMLAAMYTHGVSMCFTGETGSGKTTLLSYILSQVPYEKRLITIEQGTREFDCTARDESGRILNSVVHLSTKQSDDPKQNISQVKLLETCMTMNPDCIAVGESKGEEAMQAVNAANTGHAVITTTHANSAEDTYFRLLSLCKMAFPGMDDKMLQSLIVRAFPIALFIKKMPDHTRKVLQINEAVVLEDGRIEQHPLYEYKIESTEAPDGTPKTTGHFERVSLPSETLKRRMVQNGLSRKMTHEIFEKGD